MKTKIKKGLLIAMIFLIGMTSRQPVMAFEKGEYEELANRGARSILVLDSGDYASIRQYEYFRENGRKEYQAYFYQYDGTGDYRARKVKREQKLQDDTLRSIILAGYPYHKYTELGCKSEYPAYVATQLCILEHTQGEDLSRYRAVDTDGEEVLQAIQKIKENIENQYYLGIIPTFSVIEDSGWEEYPYDSDFLVKTMHIDCEPENYRRAFTIEPQEEQIEILGEDNFKEKVFYANRIWKVRIPKTAKDTGFEISLKVYTEDDMDTIWMAPSIENGDMFLLTQERSETKSIEYKETIEKPKEEMNPEKPEDGTQKDPNENEGNQENNEKPSQGNEQEEPNKPEGETKPDESHNGNENQPKPEEGKNETINENQNQNHQNVSIVFQPTQPIQNVLNQEIQTNVKIELTMNPEALLKWWKQEKTKDSKNEDKNQKEFEEKQETQNQMETQNQEKIVQEENFQKKTETRKILTSSKINTKKLPRTGY